ncbi:MULTISPECIES: YheT family hydrolase [unclassified Schlesneria]|uniref:YheT family hydrolase n=1 Tax=unclassified Schlesneria TaxID=2762017 RepID=UPI002F06EF70
MSAMSTESAISSLDGPARPRDSFQPPWIFRNGHVQTLAGTYLFGRNTDRLTFAAPTVQHLVSVDNGDRVVFHDDCPVAWKPGDRVAIMLHGLAGSHQSPYMKRIAVQLCQHGVRTMRMDFRGCGAGMTLARYPYHSGRSDDLLATLRAVQELCPGSPVSLIGFSMGGNIALKFLGERGPLDGISRAVAVCPPIDLSLTIDFIGMGLARAYDAYFTKTCIQNVRRRLSARPDSVIPAGWFDRPPRTMREFDETFTAPVCGFASAADYYEKSSSRPYLSKVMVPTLLIAAQDDPVIPFTPFLDTSLSSSILLRAPRYGGHIGFVTTRGPAWLDQQIVDWTLS